MHDHLANHVPTAVNRIPNFDDPLHHKGDFPCEWCGERWRSGINMIHHEPGCAYIAHLKADAEG